MRIFLSYASEDRTRIEPIRLALVGQGHDIFYDREDLKPGEAFDAKIRSAIERCDLFVCFLTPHTVDAGSYTLNELLVAQRKWPSADGRVLPVILAEVPRKDIPAYLRSVTCLTPKKPSGVSRNPVMGAAPAAGMLSTAPADSTVGS